FDGFVAQDANRDAERVRQIKVPDTDWLRTEAKFRQLSLNSRDTSVDSFTANHLHQWFRELECLPLTEVALWREPQRHNRVGSAPASEKLTTIGHNAVVELRIACLRRMLAWHVNCEMAFGLHGNPLDPRFGPFAERRVATNRGSCFQIR